MRAWRMNGSGSGSNCSGSSSRVKPGLPAAQQQQQQQQGGGIPGPPPAAAGAGGLGRDNSLGAGGGGSRAAAAAAGGRAGGAAAAAGVVLLPQVSLMTCFARWLAHSSSRELLRAKLDSQLLQYPGVAAITLQCCHSCTSAVQLAPSLLLAAPGAPGSRRQRASDLGSGRDADLSSGSNVLVLLNDTSISLEGPGLGLLAGARGLLGQHGRPQDVQQAVMYLHALPGLLAPLLQQLQCGSDSSS
ncbi:hypothetical protein COO60DRAFT_71364 [Scenedesmus sp. NREL 46B-D3]|nr:hypothetical protein COO60DRAFT_71364 [Scenedesmus sp. NREL 46B-D3]